MHDLIKKPGAEAPGSSRDGLVDTPRESDSEIVGNFCTHLTAYRACGGRRRCVRTHPTPTSASNHRVTRIVEVARKSAMLEDAHECRIRLAKVVETRKNIVQCH